MHCHGFINCPLTNGNLIIGVSVQLYMYIVYVFDCQQKVLYMYICINLHVNANVLHYTCASVLVAFYFGDTSQKKMMSLESSIHVCSRRVASIPRPVHVKFFIQDIGHLISYTCTCIYVN